MKKLMLIGAILVGVAVSSQAGVSIRVGIGLPVIPAPVVVRPAPICAPPVVYAPPVCAPSVVIAAPVCPPPRVVVPCPPVRYYRPDYRYDRGHYRGHGHGRW